MNLVCPRCRRIESGSGSSRLVFFQLVEEPDGYRCRGCGAIYPVVDNIPIIFRDLASYLNSEGPELLRRRDLPVGLGVGLARGAGGCLARNDKLLEVYRNVPVGPLHHWLTRQLAEAPGPVLEGGCGLGISPQSIGLDSNFALLHASVCERKVIGDLADPPFEAGSFGTVVLANVLDSCADPALVLAQALALLKPGGTLIITCAFAFQDSITAPQRQFTESQLITGINNSFFGYPLRASIQEVAEAEWVLPISERTEHRHRCLCIRANTPGS